MAKIKYEIQIEKKNGRHLWFITRFEDKAQRIKQEYEEEGATVTITEFEPETRDFCELVMEACNK